MHNAASLDMHLPRRRLLLLADLTVISAMFRRLLLFSLLFLRLAASDEAASLPAITLREISAVMAGRSLRISLLIFPGKDFRIRVIDNAGENNQARFQTLAEAAESRGFLAGCNGGFFERQPFTPVGLMVSAGRRSGRYDPESWMNGLLIVRGVIASLESTSSFTDAPDVTELIQSGPWLVRAGQAETDNSRSQVAQRTFICHDAQGNWAIGASGRCTLAELAGALKSAAVTAVLDIHSALNFDGGPSTGLWLRRASDNFYLPERWPVRNYIGIYPASRP
jgi:hypothetical protein